MTTYAIGDIQGCYESLQLLLKKIHFSPDKDILWFTGDLVNRGPDSFKVLQFVQDLQENAITVLGNHDLHMLAVITGLETPRPKDSLDEVINSPLKNAIIDWVRQQPLMHIDHKAGYVLTHAGVYPAWEIPAAETYAREVETVLQGDTYIEFLQHMYGNNPNRWSEDLESWDRLRFITNCFTRMRYVSDDFQLDLKQKGSPENTMDNLKPWFFHGQEKRDSYKVIFGHWSTLGYKNECGVYSLDTGCLWGGKLTALALVEQPYTISVDCGQSMFPD